MADLDSVLQQVVELVGRFGLSALGSIAILLVGSWAVRLIKRPLFRVLERSKLDDAIAHFLTSLVGYALLAFVVIAALSNLGVATGSFVAVLGAAGLAIGLAMEGSLGNLAAGILIATFRPFSAGDLIEAADHEGIVEKITIFNTTMVTLDNETVIVPNAELTSASLINYSAREFVRVEVPAVVGHEASIGKVRQVLEAVPPRCSRVLDEPVAEVQVTELTEAGVRVQLEVSVLPKDREDAVFEVAEAIKRAFEDADIRAPRQRLDIRMESGAGAS